MITVKQAMALPEMFPDGFFEDPSPTFLQILVLVPADRRHGPVAVVTVTTIFKFIRL